MLQQEQSERLQRRGREATSPGLSLRTAEEDRPPSVERSLHTQVGSTVKLQIESSGALTDRWGAQ